MGMINEKSIILMILLVVFWIGKGSRSVYEKRIGTGTEKKKNFGRGVHKLNIMVFFLS